MVKFPSLATLFNTAKKVVRRFPFEVMFTVLGTLSATIMVEVTNTRHESETELLLRLLFASVIGLVLSLSASLYSSSKGLNLRQDLLLKLVVILLTGLIFFLLNPNMDQLDYPRFILLAISFHLLVSYAAFTLKGQINAFWQFNKTLFLRFLSGALYSAVLYLGLAAAIGSMNLLFNFNFEWDTFAILWILIVGLFQTFYFLAGVPENLAGLQDELEYPRGLKLFTQYVLIPLASVYAVILLSYELKIIIQWELPKGLVSNLILGYAVFGILSLLLIYPVRNQDENKWLKTFSNYFYFLLIPLIMLLFWAVGARVYDYGITEQRYFLIVLALWLTFITIYFLISKRQDIRIIPVSLSIVVLLSAVGPQSAFNISRISQQNQLKELFGKYNSLENGKVIPISTSPDSVDAERMVNITRYIAVNYGLNVLDEVVYADLKKMETILDTKKVSSGRADSYRRFGVRDRVVDSLIVELKIPNIAIYPPAYPKVRQVFRPAESQTLDVSGFTKIHRVLSNGGPGNGTFILLNGKRLHFKQISNYEMELSENGNRIVFDMNAHLAQLKSNAQMYREGADSTILIVPDADMRMEKQLGNVQATLFLSSIEGSIRFEKTKSVPAVDFEGYLLLK